MMMSLTPVVLEGETVRLEPISQTMLPELTKAALSSRDIWTHIPYRVETAADVTGLVAFGEALLAEGKALTFATRLRSTGEIVGSSSYFLTAPAVPTIEIGGTWIVPRWQRTRVNTEAKRLMIAHCFEALGCARVELKTDARNSRSRAAIARIGAREEGTLRCHMRRADGTLRDSVYFSIVASEWPDVRARLDAMLVAYEQPASPRIQASIKSAPAASST